MTVPYQWPDDEQARIDWLLKYIAVQKLYDKKVVSALQRAMYDAGKSADKLKGDTIGKRTKRYQANLVRNEIRAVIKTMFKDLVPTIHAGQQDAAEAAATAALKQDAKVLKALFPDPKDRKTWEVSFKQSARHGIGAMVTRIEKTQLPLSKRVYKTSAWTSGNLDKVINSHLARGSSAQELAKAVRKYIDPKTPGGVSYAALRLARSEINNAFHAMSIDAAAQFPWVEEMEWHLSKSHGEEGCLCEFYADEGLFPIDDVPPKPHPQCMCFVVPHAISWPEFENKFKSGLFIEFYENKHGNTAA